MGKQRLNSTGYTVLIIGLLGIIATVAALASTFAWLQGRDQIDRLEGIAANTRDLLQERIRQNDTAATERAAQDAERQAQQDRANELITEAIERIQLNTATSVDCLYLRDQGLRPSPCKEVNDRVDRLRGGLPLIPTTTTTKPRIPATTSTTRPPSPTTTITRTSTTTTTPPCRGLNILGICIGG